jgi:hypothetical protein
MQFYISGTTFDNN